MPLSFVVSRRKQCSLFSQNPAFLILQPIWYVLEPQTDIILLCTSELLTTLIIKLLRFVRRGEKSRKYYQCSDTVAWKEVYTHYAVCRPEHAVPSREAGRAVGTGLAPPWGFQTIHSACGNEILYEWPSAAGSSSFAFRRRRAVTVVCNIPRRPEVTRSKQLRGAVLWVQTILGHFWSSDVGRAVNLYFPVFLTRIFCRTPKFGRIFLNQALTWYAVFI